MIAASRLPPPRADRPPRARGSPAATDGRTQSRGRAVMSPGRRSAGPAHPPSSRWRRAGQRPMDKSEEGPGLSLIPPLKGDEAESPRQPRQRAPNGAPRQRDRRPARARRPVGESTGNPCRGSRCGGTFAALLSLDAGEPPPSFPRTNRPRPASPTGPPSGPPVVDFRSPLTRLGRCGRAPDRRGPRGLGRSGQSGRSLAITRPADRWRL